MLISAFIISIPIIDLLTALDERLNILAIPIGTIIKLLFLIAAIAYSFRFSNKKEFFLLTSVFLIYILHAFANNIFASSGVFFDDVRLLLKYWSLFFFSIFALIYVRKNAIDKKVLLTSLSISLILYSFFIIFPTIINANFPSYYYTEEGSVGWYYSANEIGPIIILLIIFANYAIKSIGPKPIYLSSAIVGIISVSLLSTKTALMSLFLFLIIQFFVFIIKKYKRLSFINIIFLIITVCSMLFTSTTQASILQMFDKALNTQKVSSVQMVENIKASDNKSNDVAPRNDEQIVEETDVFFEKMDIIMSHRLTKTVNILEQNQDVTVPQLLFGKTYYYLNSEVKTAEIDYVDFVLHFGIVGTILFFCVIIYLIISVFKTSSLYFKFIWLLFPFIAGLAGHVLTSPSVCIYLAISLMLFYKPPLKIEEKLSNN